MPELRRKTAAQLEADTARAQLVAAVAGAVLLSVAGFFGGLALAEWLSVSPSLAVAGACFPLGTLAVYFATRRPPEVPVEPSRKAAADG